MNAMQFWQDVKTPAAKAVAEAAGTSWNYFKHLAHNRKRPGVDLARRLVEESRKQTPGHELTLNELLVPSEQIKGRKRAV